MIMKDLTPHATMSGSESERQPTEVLAAYVANSDFKVLPQPVIKEALRSILNFVGCAIGGSNHETVDIAVEAFAPYSGTPTATIFGRSERFDTPRAALINGISSHVLDFDDTHPECLLHPGSPVASAAFALAETFDLSGREIINAFVVGVEVECRVALAVAPGHYAAGWHATGTAGVFGAAAAASRLLKLDALHTKWALGIAATQSAGLREMFGSMCKSLNPGKAAENGLTAALLAAKGFTSADRPIEGKSGFAAVTSPTRDLAQITKGLGTEYLLLGNTYKAYACGIVIHPAIDGCIRIRERRQGSAQDVAAIELIVHPLVIELTGKQSPFTGLEGKFSVYHSAAAAYLDGDCGEAQYSDARVQAADVVSLRGTVKAVTDASLRLEEAYVDITFHDGQRERIHVEFCVGSLQNPLTDEALDAKVFKLCEGIIPEMRARESISFIRSLEQCKGIKGNLDLMRRT